MKNLPSERGQAIVIIVFAIFGLLAMGALAIDIGQLYAARRNAQNAADAAALAAAYDIAAGSKDVATALEIAYAMTRKNGFSNDGKTNWVLATDDPIDSPYCTACGGKVDGTDYVQVTITMRLNPIFAQFIYSGAKEFKVEAVARAIDADEVSAGNALMALTEETDKKEVGINMDGNVSIEVSGGNIRANGNMTRKGEPDKSQIKVGTYDHIYYGGTFEGKTGTFTGKDENNKLITPEENPAVHLGKFAPPACPTLQTGETWPAETSTWSKGTGFRYKTDTVYGATTYYYNNGLSVDTLPPGIHCIDGGISKGNISGSDILVVLLSGDIKMTGGDSFDLRAATDMKDMNGNQWGGMVFYIPPTNQGDSKKPAEFKFGGNAGGYFYGLVYAPKATCDMGGTPDGEAIHSAIICNKIKIHGNPSLKIQYVPEELFHFPPLVELVQ